MRALLATDGRPPALAAEALLRAIADPARVQVSVLHVDEYGDPAVADRVASAVLGGSLERLEAAGIDAESKRARGDAKRAIRQEIDDGDHGLVVMGVGNTSWLGRLILGGVRRAARGSRPERRVPSDEAEHFEALDERRIDTGERRDLIDRSRFHRVTSSAGRHRAPSRVWRLTSRQSTMWRAARGETASAPRPIDLRLAARSI